MTSITVRPTDFAGCVRMVGERYLGIFLLLLCISVMFVGPGYTSQATLAWDPNTE
jgi:hypothetical protein